jgi:uncharacterized protein with GYD domain
MESYIMLTRLAPGALESPKTLEELEKQVMERIRKSCTDVEWMFNFAVLGPYDYVDAFRSPDAETAFKVAALVRTLGHAHTEVWRAVEWSRFKDMIRDLPGKSR